MTEQEKIVKGLECIAEIGECDCNDCEYAEDGNPAKYYKCQEKFAKDAITLLKTQEPKEPTKVHDISEQSDGSKKGCCAYCGSKLDKLYNAHFCGTCGRELNWEWTHFGDERNG